MGKSAPHPAHKPINFNQSSQPPVHDKNSPVDIFDADTHPCDLDQRLRDRLAQSLEHVFERGGNTLGLEPQKVIALCDRIHENRLQSAVFARYFELVLAIDANDLTLARNLAGELYSASKRPVNFTIAPYSSRVLGDDAERMAKLAFASFSNANPMAAPGDALFESHRQKLLHAIEIIRTVDESIGQELEALVSQIVVAVQNRDTNNSKGFGGVSSLMLWGSIFINAEHYTSLYQVVECLVHEVTHCVLFGYSAETPLVHNPAHERYPSPLRSDPRPMDGIYHATLVSARIVLFTQQLLDKVELDQQQNASAQQTLSNYRRMFSDGVQIIKEHGQLSTMGQTFLDTAESLLATPA